MGRSMAVLEQHGVFIFIRLHQIVASPPPPKHKKSLKQQRGFLNSGVNEKVPGVKLPACRTPSVDTNISFVRHMFLRQDPSKSCSINFHRLFYRSPLSPLCHFFKLKVDSNSAINIIPPNQRTVQIKRVFQWAACLQMPSTSPRLP